MNQCEISHAYQHRTTAVLLSGHEPGSNLGSRPQCAAQQGVLIHNQTENRREAPAHCLENDRA